MSGARFVVGIDLGTTHTVVASARIGAEGGAHKREIAVFPIVQHVSAGELEARGLLPSALYAPLEGEVSGPYVDGAWLVGELARARGVAVPGRAVMSAKSWLCHSGVDRLSACLPWGRDDDDGEGEGPRLSPVEASARVLAHVRRAWDEAHGDAPLAEQELVLTVPASFDEDARELTLRAALDAGLAPRLLEEPQAAFYDYLKRHGQAALAPLLHGRDDALVLVCDVGGGTTDLSLLRLSRGETELLDVARVAVGRHLLLGGDNMDLALAHRLEGRLSTGPERLAAGRFSQLVLACRGAKETLLGTDGPTEVPVTLLGTGSRLVGGARTTTLTRAEAEEVVLEGFFPSTARDARPDRGRAGLVAFGLPYERDTAIPRHVAAFLERHAHDSDGPAAVLLNGGVFRAERIAERLAAVIGAFCGRAPVVLPHADPDRAVARGAVAHGLALLGDGTRIGGGVARGYYVGLGQRDGGAQQAVCIVPRGAVEGSRHVAHDRQFALVVGRTVRFPLFASDARAHAVGDVVTIDDDAFEPLPPIAARFSGAPTGGELRVRIEAELTAIGTLDLACVEAADVPVRRRFRLAFQLREQDDGPPLSTTAAPASVGRRISADALTAIERAFGKRSEATPREVKDLVRELERLLGERPTWSLELARTIADRLLVQPGGRHRSAEHERVFWMLAGYCLRPGFGDALDTDRIARLVPLFEGRLAFPGEARGYQQFWIAWRRVAAGLDERSQVVLRDTLDPLLAPAERGLKRPKRVPLALDDALELAAHLERAPTARRIELGEWLVERTWTQRDARLWSAIGRVGARVPTYASLDRVVPASVAERWLERLLREPWGELATASEVAVQLARRTGDRARDVSERLRRDVERKLAQAKARDEWLRAVREVVPIDEAARRALYGEGLPVGLRLVEER